MAVTQTGVRPVVSMVVEFAYTTVGYYFVMFRGYCVISDLGILVQETSHFILGIAIAIT